MSYKTHREIQRNKRNIARNMQQARQYKDLYMGSEESFGTSLRMLETQKNRGYGARQQLQAQMRGMGIFGTADVLGGSVGVLRPPMPAVAQQMRHAREVMGGTVKQIQSLTIADGKARAKAHSQTPEAWVIKSSWVKALGYDKQTKILYAALGDSEKGQPVKDYYWGDIGELIYIVWRKAQGRCKTTERKPKGAATYGTTTRRQQHIPLARWERNKSPSLGATFWHTVGRQLVGKRI